MSEEHTYPLNAFDVPYGDRVCTIKGYAKYEINSGLAEFFKVSIKDWKFKKQGKKSNPETDDRMTEQDIQALQDAILAELNENYELCEYLASDDANGF